MARWNRMEDYLYDEYDKNPKFEFTSRDYAATTGLDADEASGDIQAYLDAQRRQPSVDVRTGKHKGGSETLFVLRRKPGLRTSSAVWMVGVSTRDADKIGDSLSSDVRRKVMRAFQPDLLRLKEKNPRAARKVDAQITAMVDGALKILEVAAHGTFGMDGDEPEE